MTIDPRRAGIDPALWIGLISGTSIDGIDAVLAEFGTNGQPRTLLALTHPWPDALRNRLLEFSQGTAPFDLDRYGETDVAVGEAFADAALAVLARSGHSAAQVRAIGSHGQTLRHRPDGHWPFTLQIGDPTVIAERTGIDVIADFRRADVAAGGQGAPLLPALHAMLLAAPGHVRAVLNLGGIGNLTVLDADGGVTGFDTGPANGLLDAWCLRHRGTAFDRDGRFAAAGQVDAALLDALLADPYFARPAPKSTGREYFHLAWLERHAPLAGLNPADVQATLLELSARSIAEAVAAHAPAAEQVIACGGGVHNRLLMERLGARLAPCPLTTTAAFGIDPDYLEATAFAWLARQRLHDAPGNLPAVTGARGPRVLGAWHRAPH